MKKILTTVFLILFFCFTPIVLAADLNFECLNSPDHCNLTGTNPLFSSSLDGVWYPGRVLTKTINLKNSTSDQADLKLRGRRSSSSNILENVLEISITPKLGGSPIWSGSLSEFYNKGYISMGTFNGGTGLDYNFAVNMDSAANNDYQGLESIFDLDLNFASFGSSGVAGLTAAGGGGSASVCSDSAPTSAPTLLSASVTGENQVTLTWSAAEAPVTYYLVSFRTDGGQQYGNPNVGGAGTTSYTVTNLSGGTTYYFKVRAGNGCMPGAFSQESSPLVPSGGVITGPATSFQQNVLGITSEEATPSAETKEGGETLGEGTGNIQGAGTALCKECFWWPILLGEAIVLLIYYRSLLRKNPSRKKYLLSILIPVATFIIFILLNRNCFGGWFYINSSSFFCKYFWLFDSILFLLMLIYTKVKSSTDNNN